MTREELYQRIVEYLVDYFEIPKERISLESNFYTDLELDSIDAIDLIVKLQEITQKKIQPTEFKEVRTVGHVVDLVMKIIENDQ
jgi:acyl carrier protein